MSLVIPIKSPLKIKNKLQCSFCGEVRPCVESLISNKSICYLCHQNAKEIIGKIPTKAVQCLHCHKYDNLVVEMKNRTLIHYKSPGLDINGITFYVISKFNGNYKEGTKQSQAWCGYCKNEIPLYILSRNDYIL